MRARCLAGIRFAVTVFFCMTLIGGCGGGDGGTTGSVVVQLTNGGSSYQVEGMTVSIQKSGGPVLSGITGTNGIARIAVTETGNYQVVRVVGVDASGLAQGSEGREFLKSSPLADPFPKISYDFTGTIPVATATASGGDYPVSAPVPSIIKVTVLGTGSVTGAPSASVSIGTASFAGRVILSNINCSDSHSGIVFQSNDPNNNRLIIYPNISGVGPQIIGGNFYGGPAFTGTNIGSTASYLQAGPIYFEAPGGGDWSLGYNLSATEVKTRNGLGGADITRNFSAFGGGASPNFVVSSFSTQGGTGQTYKFDYRIFKFDIL